MSILRCSYGKQLSKKMKTNFTRSNVKTEHFILIFMAILLIISKGVMTSKFLLMKLRNNTAIGDIIPRRSIVKNGGYRRIEKNAGNVNLSKDNFKLINLSFANYIYTLTKHNLLFLKTSHCNV